MVSRLSFAVVLVVAVVAAPICTAQRRGGFGGAGHGFASSGRGGFFGSRRSEFARGYFLGDFPYFYDDYPSAPAAGDAGPQVILLQQAAAEAAPQPKLAPLLIELQGDRYVRYGGAAGQGPGNIQSARNGASRGEREQSGNNSSDPAPLAPTVLIYRDGHREEVPDYAIVGHVIYAHGVENGEPGYGMKNIRVSELNLAETIKVNRENGVSFVLPSGPNEVVTRP